MPTSCRCASRAIARVGQRACGRVGLALLHPRDGKVGLGQPRESTI
jgi:hypothetical protein